jgi:hypothetical protein
MLFAIPVIWMRVHDTEVTAADFVVEKAESQAPVELSGGTRTVPEKDGAIATEQPKESAGERVVAAET